MFRLIVLASLLGSSSAMAVSNEEKISAGKKVYEQNCIACHGMRGDGRGPASAAIANPKPRNFLNESFKYGSSDKEIFETVTKGVNGTAMPPWATLPESDRWNVVAYIKSLKK